MMLYLTSEAHQDAFDVLTRDSNMVIKKFVGTFSLKSFVLQDLRNFSHCSFLVLDLDALKGRMNEIMEGITAFQNMYTARIIIFVSHLNGNVEIIKGLLDKGMKNIIYADNVEDLREQIKQSVSPEGLEENEFLGHLNIMRNQDSHGVMPLREIHKLVDKEVKIAVCGAIERVGTTTLGINLSQTLASIGLKVAYVEANKSGHMRMIADYHGFNVMDNEIGYRHQGVTYLELDNPIEEVFDFVVYDIGLVNESFMKSLENNFDLVILCSSYQPHELKKVEPCCMVTQGTGVKLLFNMISEDEQHKLMKQYESPYFYGYTRDMYDVEMNKEMWMYMLKAYIKSEDDKEERRYDK